MVLSGGGVERIPATFPTSSSPDPLEKRGHLFSGVTPLSPPGAECEHTLVKGCTPALHALISRFPQPVFQLPVPILCQISALRISLVYCRTLGL